MKAYLCVLIVSFYLIAQILADGHGQETPEPEPESTPEPHDDHDHDDHDHGDKDAMCHEGTCMCQDCNACSCMNGMWACTLMECHSHTMVDDGYGGQEPMSCAWHQTKTFDEEWKETCQCDCIPPPSAGVQVKAGGVMLMGLAALCALFHL